MNSDFIEQHLMTNIEISELMKRWERRDLRPAKKRYNSKVDYSVSWGTPSPENPALNKHKALSIEDARKVLYDGMKLYFDDTGTGYLLVKAQAGSGKSTTAIKFAQDMARNGSRVLYLMPRHSYYQDIEESPFFDESLWYHWRPTHGHTDDGEEMCAKRKVAQIWMSKGYPLISVCKALCLDNGHMSVCPYRQQANLPYPIIAGVHNHATTGLGITNFDLVIVDELPAGAFFTERIIRTRKIDSIGTGNVGRLLSKLREISSECNGPVRQRELLSLVAPLVRTVVEEIRNNVEDIEWKNRPPIYQESDIEKAKEWFLVDLVSLLIPELIAYEQGLDDWLSRVYVDKDGLHLMLKSAPWESLPPKLIVLDATGRADIYEHLFLESFTTLEPNTRLSGNIYQIANTMYNIGSVLKDETDSDGNRKLTWRGREMLALCEFIAAYHGYRRVCVVTYKGARYMFDAAFGEMNVMHFGGSRGANNFMWGDEPVDAVIVAGTPAPPDPDIMQMAAQIYFDPQVPERSKISIHSGIEVRSNRKIEYPYVNEQGLAPFRYVGGFWEYDILQNVMGLFREDELRQSLHRGRPLILNTDIWMLTTMPTTEPLTGFYENPDQIVDDAVGWKNWLRVDKVAKHLKQGVYTADDLAHLIGTTKGYAKKWLAGYVKSKSNLSWDGQQLTVI